MAKKSFNPYLMQSNDVSQTGPFELLNFWKVQLLTSHLCFIGGSPIFFRYGGPLANIAIELPSNPILVNG